MNEKTLNRLKPFLYGKLLGGATIEKTAKPTHNNRLKIKQKLEHEEYVRQCWNKIHNFSNKMYIDKSARTYKGVTKFHKSWCFKTKALPVFTELRKEWYAEDGRKILPVDLEFYFTPELLAYWFMDDGTLFKSRNKKDSSQILNYHEIFLYTNSFTELEVDRLIHCFYRYGIHPSKRQDRVTKEGRPMYIISIGNMEDQRIFKSLVEPYICECLKYKIDF